jgi:hypothetical protein
VAEKGSEITTRGAVTSFFIIKTVSVNEPEN